MAPARLLLLLPLVTPPLAAQDEERFDGESLQGWETTDFKGGKPEGSNLGVSNKSVSFHYRREVLSPLAHAALLTELQEIRLTLRSQVNGAFMLGVEDRDGASFHFPFDLSAGQRKEVRARPSDFKLNDDSRVRKPVLDPQRLGLGYVLLDLGPLLGSRGENVLAVDTVVVRRSAYARLPAPLIVDRLMEISQSSILAGDLIIRKGGHLKVTSPRFLLLGDVRAQDGIFELAGGVFSLPQKYNHERSLIFRGASRFRLEHSLWTPGLPAGVNFSDASALEVEDSECQGGLTCDAGDGTRVAIRRTRQTGEFVIAAGADISIEDSSSVILWLPVGPQIKGKISLPPGSKVENWTSGPGMRVRVRRCENVLWCIISQPGSDAVIERTDLYAAGLYFDGNARAAFRGVQNGRRMQDYSLEVSDRKLRFVDCRVSAWNFYSNGKARVSVEGSTFGESLAFGESELDIRNSTCDGSGGYLGSSNQARLKLSGCKVSCLVVARDESSISLDRCEVSGDVRATARSSLRLTQCRVNGRVEKDAGAQLIQE
ncbi:MAG: hypothetical protein HYU36_01840 [Planctomycetes bacterium]|nr:hypothetical protein [Planctomycetota bacterium]